MIILSFIHFFRVFYSLYSIQYFFYFFKSLFYYYSQYFSSIFFSIRYSTFSLLVLKFRSFQLSFPPFYPFANFFLQCLSLSLDSQYSTIPFIFYTFLIRFFFNFPLSTRFQFHYFDNTFSTIPAFFLFYILPFRDILPQFHFLFPYIFFLHFYSTPFSLSTRYSVSPFLF